MRKVKFVNDQYYHIYNRGVDKRTIFQDIDDLKRFYQSMQEFNILEPIGSIYENSFLKRKEEQLGNSVPKLLIKDKLVEFICYNLLPNHYHFSLKQLKDKGIQKFMHKLSLGYTNYFNKKHKRSGSLFQGRFKAVYVKSNEQLLHLSVYINLNHQVHNLEKFGGSATKLFKGSWGEYVKGEKGICEKDIVLHQFGKSSDYKKFAEDSLKRIKENKEIKKLLLEY